MRELKPCPFCGGKAVMTEYLRNSWWAMCEECESETSVYYTEQEAIEAWNRMVNDEDC